MDTSERKVIDLLVNEFWRLGFFTVSRRFGTYLPEPENIGKFKVDVVGRQKEKYAIGIILTKEEIFKPDLLEKISYLASRKSRTSHKPITLLIGVTDYYFKRVKELLTNIDEKIRRNIRLVRLVENNFEAYTKTVHKHQMIFS